mgnify:CR=1 FL=1
MIETSGVIEKEQGNGFYLVTLEQPEGHQCLCRAAGKLTKFRIKLLAGDKVLVEISPYDLSRGRITYRERNAGGAKPTTNKNNPLIIIFLLEARRAHNNLLTLSALISYNLLVVI